jgi:alpha-beta hydrolase superfamily lysophospholipase
MPLGFPQPRTAYVAQGAERVFTVFTAALDTRSRGTVIIAPPFGKRINDLLYVALVLRMNGFDVLRFDAHAHIGSSTGEIENFTLGGLQRDLTSVRQCLVDEHRPLVLVGISLSSPIVLRHAARHRDVDGLVTLVGVVDVPDTLERIVGAEVAALHRDRSPLAPTHHRIFGYDVLAREFVADMFANGHDGLGSSLRDATAAGVPMHLVGAREDQFVCFEHLATLAATLPSTSSLTVVENSSHELSRSLTATKKALRALARGCLAIAGAPLAEPILPSLAEVIEATAREQEFLRELNFTSPEHVVA